MFKEWVGVTSSGQKTPLAFVEDGLKNNQHYYINQLKDKVVLLILDNGLTIQQDGAAAHTAKMA